VTLLPNSVIWVGPSFIGQVAQWLHAGQKPLKVRKSFLMPAKKRKNVISGVERHERLEATAREFGTSDAPRAFKQAFDKVVRPSTVTPSALLSHPSGKRTSS
jgi:hypothetical protein